MVLRSLFAAAVALSLMAGTPGTASADPIPGQGTWETELKPRDVNHDGIVDAWYDTALDVTWLAQVSPIGVVGWDQTLSWLAHLNLGGYTGWRLPVMAPANGTGWNLEFSFDGDTDSGYNNRGTEFGHLFYVTLGNKAPCAPGSDATIRYCRDPWPADTGQTHNTGPFRDLASEGRFSFWMATHDGGWAAADLSGLQIACSLCDNTTSLGAGFFALRDGDLLVAAVPEPAPFVLALAGGVVLALVRPRRRLS